ncbi:MAG: F0F1 ATP synthase subunit B [Candidatus Omnitrophica bacterium]|nr:F0F1 ATP synthase subunit B [Candidatus Omnitrophota bacterium]
MDPKVILEAIPEILTQLAGFLIVFFILKKYAFGSVMSLLDERKNTIEAALNEAESKKKEMESLKNDYESKLRSSEQEARKKIQEAIEDGQRIATEIRQKASAEAAAQLERVKREIDLEMKKAKESLRDEIVELSSEIASKVVAKEIKPDDNRKFIEDILSQTGKLS